MANTLEKLTGKATIAGSTVYTVPTGDTLTIVGLRAANNDSVNDHTFRVEIASTLITGADTPLPIGSALEALSGSKVVAEAGDAIVAYGDTDNDVDIYISFLRQN